MYLISDGGVNLNTPDTIEAIMLTKNIGNIDGVKLDVRVSIDNIFVLSKYNDLKKLTCSNKKVNEVEYSYLKKVKFPSHIFKYYIPTLEEILKNYDKKKIIVLELYDDNNLDELYFILIRYPYKYYFISRNNIIEKLKELKFNNIGRIIDGDNIQIMDSISNHDIYDNTFLIIEKNNNLT